MLPESQRYYRSRGGGSRRSSNRGGGSGRSSSRRAETGAGVRNARVKNPAGFELLGIGVAFGLCVGFVLGLGFNRMTNPGSVLSQQAPAPAANPAPERSPARVAASAGLSEDERKRKQIQTQQRIADWEKETFQLDQGDGPRPGAEQRKAWAIIDGLEESIDEP